jgi:hypothetical protein
MRRIKMRTLMAGPEGPARQPGGIYPVDDALAERLIKGGFAEEAPPESPEDAPKPESGPETASVEGGETAVVPKPKHKKRGRSAKRRGKEE